MRVLLDTLYLYRLMAAEGIFADPERTYPMRTDVQIWASAVSLWEMRLKYGARDARGRRKSPHEPMQVVTMLHRLGVPILNLTPQHAACELEQPLRHKDPFDELLLAQAQEEGLRLLTTDSSLVGHPAGRRPLAARGH